MPITVREIGVKVRVRGKESGPLTREDAPSAPAGLTALQREELTEECIRRVLDVLRREREP